MSCNCNITQIIQL